MDGSLRPSSLADDDGAEFCRQISCGAHVVCPNAKAVQRIRAERRRDGDVCGIAAPRHQDSADARHVVPRIERVPLTAEIDFEPGREVSRRIGRRRADVTQISRAVASRYVQRATERDG